ncbi:MAG: hypothetical protein LAT62_13450 [Natronospirillum sp.]|uniref:type IV CRISPR-associated protein Csf1 n=1 Tax=Natronospirillum sp. TaxID=2812955 RepID=UPI0025EDD676|nr:type IV CRISPR-associated protein Csf1 [Natronospirillum sp.]MCH8552939.1 hypothetical protein [Natronospirillum sp.]
MLYPSDVADALGLKPDADLLQWKGDPGACSHCGRPIDEGDAYSPTNLGKFFSDSRDLASATGIVCWRCVHLRKKPMLYGLSAAVITEHEIYPISKDIHKAWLFTDPPNGPFLAVHSSSTMQHLSWRTPVTQDSRRIQIRFGPSLFVVRPSNIRQALAVFDRFNEGEEPAARKSPLLLDRKAAAPYHGQLRSGAREKLAQDDIQLLLNLSPGEYWALSFLMHSKKPEPEKPEPITAKVLAKLTD